MKVGITSAALSAFLVLNCSNQVYASYGSKKLLSQNKISTNSTPGNLGVVLRQNAQGQTIIDKVIPGSPAQLSGIASGEVLLAVDGISIVGRNLASIQTKLRGQQGSYVELSLSSSSKGEYKKNLKRVNSASINSGVQSRNSVGRKSQTKFNSPKAQSPKSYQFKRAQVKPNSSTKVNTTKQPKSMVPTNLMWTSYQSPSGNLSMQVPDGWEVEIESKSGKINVYSFDDESISIFPFYLPKTSLNSTQAKGLFNALLKSQTKNQNWSSIQSVSQNALKRIYNGNGLKQVASLVWLSNQGGTAGRLIIAQAPQGHDKNYSKVFSKILSSVRLQASKSVPQASTAPASPQISWTKYVDPKQGAFSIEVPQGWQVSGAMEQPQTVDTRPWVKAVSPDNSIAVFLGDPTIPSYTLPTAQLSSLGFPPGSRYSPGYGFNTIVAYYTPAQKYIPNYGKRVLRKLSMTNIQLEGVNSHPKLAREWNGYYNTRQYSAASCQFSCMYNGKPAIGFFIGSTRNEQVLWYVTTLGAVMSLRGQENLAMQVYLHMYKTFQMSPRWQQSQLRLTKRFSKMMFSTWREINQIARDSYRYRNAIEDKTHRKVVNALRGTEDVVDPTTGSVYNVESGPDYHWLSKDGYTHLGTNKIIYPGADWTQLVNVQ